MAPDERMTEFPRPPDAAEPRLGDYSWLDEKIECTRLRRDRMRVWGKRGALVGGLAWFLLLGIRFIVGAGEAGTWRQSPGSRLAFLPCWTLFAVFLAGAVGASVGALIDFIRPIHLALFDTKQFEAEYGRSRPRRQM